MRDSLYARATDDNPFNPLDRAPNDARSSHA